MVNAVNLVDFNVPHEANKVFQLIFVIQESNIASSNGVYGVVHGQNIVVIRRENRICFDAAGCVSTR